MLNYELNRNVCAQQRKKSAAPWVEPRSEVAKFKEHSGWFVPMPLLSAFPPYKFVGTHCLRSVGEGTDQVSETSSVVRGRHVEMEGTMKVVCDLDGP